MSDRMPGARDLIRNDTEVTTMTLLTADDVLNKKFQATKFREGYEQDEVDEFLDEVVEAMRQLEAENADLKAKLEAANRRVAQLGEGAAIPAAPASPVSRRVRWPGPGCCLRHARAGPAPPRRARRQRQGRG